MIAAQVRLLRAIQATIADVDPLSETLMQLLSLIQGWPARATDAVPEGRGLSSTPLTPRSAPLFDEIDFISRET